MAHHVCPQSVFGGKGSSARLYEGQQLHLNCRQHHYSMNYMPTVSLFDLVGANTILSTLTTLSFTCIYRETKNQTTKQRLKREIGFRDNYDKNHTLYYLNFPRTAGCLTYQSKR